MKYLFSGNAKLLKKKDMYQEPTRLLQEERTAIALSIGLVFTLGLVIAITAVIS